MDRDIDGRCSSENLSLIWNYSCVVGESDLLGCMIETSQGAFDFDEFHLFLNKSLENVHPPNWTRTQHTSLALQHPTK